MLKVRESILGCRIELLIFFPFQVVLEHPQPPRGKVSCAGDLGDAEQHLLHPRLLCLHAPALSPPSRQLRPLLEPGSQASLNS